ncbi:bifunctional helix-turn-helix transcriptional regulator/GNAT family N-acetyltransferase [Spartinivicinus poritis]|uniref:Bifunctional helix-turn-helix transcriptional regulator/GNAT family N-acetyltransferase n=1 Tax=Spartinivicinus poritis TaxID=2994640 RepID=A0ABT5UGC5_9GAMM|nr:bifunctional helix-turn-helix transcriptional regulator/GNAT family N-acetyltransferase [Spartinivicinus sp. A2-2]MDE1465440.1 bifunctional helix-turn-helix transcriptional regulator/GNAT family N-acetyltransferase [Spartinivicinus sp. A2-2]
MQDFISELGSQALGSRLKRLSDHFMQEVTEIYQTTAVDMPPRLFPLLNLLARQQAPISTLAELLGVSHAAVSQMANTLIKLGLATKHSDSQDERRQLLTLTPKAEQLIQQLQPVWLAIKTAIDECIDSSPHNLLEALKDMEQVLNEKNLQQRVQEKLAKPTLDITIVGWQPTYKQAFYRLNRQWVDEYFEFLPLDKQQLEQPENYYLLSGGVIFFALINQQAVGTFALYPTQPGVYELSKMAVDPTYQGCNIGQRLIEHAIAQANLLGAKKIILETASKLKPALALYQKMGFTVLPHPEGEARFTRADVYMELDL